MAKILIVDDEKDIAELISDVLIDEGYDTVIKNNGLDAISEVDNDTFDLIILDIMMPGLSGTEVCNKIREKVNCPIIFVTAKTETITKVLGFEIGADDYITKPFIVEELVARIKAHIRRSARTIVENNIIKIDKIEINLESYEAFKDNERIDLSTREFELLAFLMRNAGIVLTKEHIFESVWGINYSELGSVAVYIKSLRNKIDPDEKYIKTIWGLGYKFVKVIE